MASFLRAACGTDRLAVLILAAVVLLSVIAPCIALASGSTAATRDNQDETLAAPAPPLTDPRAAEELPTSGLDRDGVLDLLEGVFERPLEGAIGPFDELAVQKVISRHAVVLSEPAVEGSAAALGGMPDSEGGSAQQPEPVLMESTAPLVTEHNNPASILDLSLERQDESLQAETPLVPFRLPTELGTGIELPDQGVTIRLADAPAERSPSILGTSVAVYPNVAEDTDLAVSPVPGGVETFTTLRTPNAPRVQTFELSLPDGATLEDDGDGARIARGDETILVVQRPSAIDAEGNAVPVELSIGDSSLEVTVSPGPDVAWPILSDPVWEWSLGDAFGAPGQAGFEKGWHWSKSTSLFMPMISYLPPGGAGDGGLAVKANPGAYSAGGASNWTYWVPRLAEEEAKGKLPTSYIVRMDLGQVAVKTSTGSFTPHVVSGIWNQSKAKWAGVPGQEALWIYFGNNAPISGYTLGIENGKPGERDQLAQHGLAVGLDVFENVSLGAGREAYVGSATVQVGDTDTPTVANASVATKYVDGTAMEPITVDAGDYGLGVKSITFQIPGIGPVAVTNPCAGGAVSPCPSTWSASVGANQYDPSKMAQGVNYIPIAAKDVVGNETPTGAVVRAQVKVDHTAPTLALSGTLTEQATVGTKLPQYTLNMSAADGDDDAAAAQATFGTAGSGPGQFKRPMGVALDATGNIWVVDRENNRLQKYDANGNFLSQFGETGTGSGKLSEPRGIAINPAGNIWVSEVGNKRLQLFKPNGELIRQITNTAIIGAFKEPYGLATGPGETLWVTDTGSHYLYRYTESGTLLQTIGSGVGGSPPDLTTPVDVDVDAFGNAWVTETWKNKVLEFGPTGNFLFSFGTEGSGQGQIKWPSGIEITASGHILVVDAGNNRVEEFMPDGTYMRQFGSTGSGNAQLSEPRGIVLGAGNTAVIADHANKRIARWSHVDLDEQSGVRKVEVKVDGISEWVKTLECDTGPCPVTGLNLNADAYPVGQHQVEVIATDGVQLANPPAKLMIETHGDRKAPGIALSGSMTEQAALGTTRPSYRIKADATDPGPSEERQSGVASLKIKVDGKVVSESAPGCPAGGCSLSREWTLESDEYQVGSHSVEVTATDSSLPTARSTTKTLTVNIARDETPPQITATGPLIEAPEGWVQQKTFSLPTTATDTNGYGVKQIFLKIDGKLVSQAWSLCELGGCSKTRTFSLNTANYEGGAHEAELIAVDWAENTATKAWTMNVDPSGDIAPSEAEATLEAIEATTSEAEAQFDPTPAIVSWAGAESQTEPKFSEEANGELFSEGNVPAVLDAELQDGFVITGTGFTVDEAEYEESFSFVPVGITESDPISISADVAAVYANTAASTDTVIRPVYDGLMSFETIRDALAPETFAWEVKLQPGQELASIDSKNVGVFFEDGVQAMLISSHGARDADGTPVETSLSVSGNEVILTVSHRVTGVVYPVTTGAGFRAGYSTVTVTPPPQPEEEGGGMDINSLVVSAPQPDGAGNEQDASASAVTKYIRTWRVSACNHGVIGNFLRCEAWQQFMRGFFYFNYFEAWHKPERDPVCWHDAAPTFVIEETENGCDWFGPNHQVWNRQPVGNPTEVIPPQSVKPKYHITAQTRFYEGVDWEVAERKFYKAISLAGEGDGTIYAWRNDHVCNPWTQPCTGDISFP